jgi:hypothetical protein
MKIGQIISASLTYKRSLGQTLSLHLPLQPQEIFSHPQADRVLAMVGHLSQKIWKDLNQVAWLFLF